MCKFCCLQNANGTRMEKPVWKGEKINVQVEAN